MNNVKNPDESSINPDLPILSRLERNLFLLIFFIEAGILFYFANRHCIPGGHDGFQFFFGQHYFLNNVINHGGIPQWIPFMTHGNLMSLGYIVTGGLLQNVLILSGGLVGNINFLPIFYLGMFIDEMVLLVGVWLLARRFLISPISVFFVALSIMGSCIWVIQPWFNFHFYYAIPLIVYFFHTFLDSGKWRYCFLSGNLMLIQSLGNLPYFLPVTSLVIFLYFLFYSIFNFQYIMHQIKKLNFRCPFIATLLVTVLTYSLLYTMMRISVDQIVNYNFQRNLDWGVSLSPFLMYGGTSWKTWIELVLGISPCLDYTLYIGIVGVPFILVGLLFNIKKSNIHFPLTVLILIFFSMGTIVSLFFFYCWPMMKYFRHLMLMSSIIKIFICFLAGFGVDVLFSGKSRQANILATRSFLTVMSISMLLILCALWLLSRNNEITVSLLKSMLPTHLPPLRILGRSLIAFLIDRITLFVFLGFVFFGVWLSANKRKNSFIFIIVLLLLHGVDIYSFKYLEISLKTVPLNDEMYNNTSFNAMPYPKRRDLTFWDNNSRAELLKILPIVEPGSVYWSTHTFLYKDQLEHPFRTDFWQLSLDNYMRAYWGQSIHDLSVKPLGLHYFTAKEFPRLEFPRTHPAILKISGVTEDKIQFFSQAETVSSIDSIVSKITDPDYKGDIIFLSPLTKNTDAGIVNQSNDSCCDLSTDKRLHLSYKVNRFDSNNLEISTDTKNSDSAWLFYSDVWHPLWKATVNGKQAPVYKANLAYKAVKLEKGYNEVHFHFESRLMTFFHYVFGFNSLIWLLIIFYLAGKIVLNREPGFEAYSAPVPE